MFLTRILYWKLRWREQESGVTHGLLLKTGKILDYDAKAQVLYFAAGRRQDKEDMAYYEGQRKLIEWIIHARTESCPTRPRDHEPGEHGHSG